MVIKWVWRSRCSAQFSKGFFRFSFKNRKENCCKSRIEWNIRSANCWLKYSSNIIVSSTDRDSYFVLSNTCIVSKHSNIFKISSKGRWFKVNIFVKTMVTRLFLMNEERNKWSGSYTKNSMNEKNQIDNIWIKKSESIIYESKIYKSKIGESKIYKSENLWIKKI